MIALRLLIGENSLKFVLRERSKSEKPLGWFSKIQGIVFFTAVFCQNQNRLVKSQEIIPFRSDISGICNPCGES